MTKFEGVQGRMGTTRRIITLPTVTMRMRVWHAEYEYEKHGANIRVATSADFCLWSYGCQVKQCLRGCHHVISTPIRLSCACLHELTDSLCKFSWRYQYISTTGYEPC